MISNPITVHIPRSSSQLHVNQMQLCQELTRLNSSLKLELEKCHKYIATLEKDLQDVQERSNYSILSENINYLSQSLEQQNIQLRKEVEKLGLKLQQKRGAVKKLEKHCKGLEVYLHQALREKEQIQKKFTKVQNLLDAKNFQQKQSIIKAQAIIKQQKDTILLQSRQLQLKTTNEEKLSKRLQQMQIQKESLIKQNEQIKQTNFNLTHHLKQMEKQYQERQLRITTQLRQLQSKNIQLTNQLNKLSITHSKSDLSNSYITTGDQSSSSKSRIWPTTQRVTLEQLSVIKQLEILNGKLLEQIRLLQEEKGKQKDRFEWLKNDIITIKLQNSSLMNKNRTLQQQKTLLERRNYQLQSRYSAPNQKFNHELSYEVGSIKSCNKTIASIGNMPTKRYPNTPQDGQIPVHDKGSHNNKSSIVYLTNSHDAKKSGIFHRPSLINFTTMR